MVLEEVERSVNPVAVKEPHFPVLSEFREASYAKRYEILMTKLVRERLYDNAALLLSSRDAARTRAFREPSAELSFAGFLTSLKARTFGLAEPST